MSNDEIKNNAEFLYKQISDAQEGLKVLRSVCKHEETFEGNYSYRIGVIQAAIICSFCGELIKIK